MIYSDTELLAIIIASGSRQLSAVELSRQILASVDNNFSKLSRLSIADFNKFNGIGDTKAIGIMASLEIARRKRDEEQPAISKITYSKQVF
ncbi:MAG: hypothetical protein QNK85_01610 [Crocinitomicaceae bacterium]